MNYKTISRILVSVGFGIFSLYNCATAYANEGAPDPARKAAFQACAADIGVQAPTDGSKHVKLDPQTRDKMHQCMADKGFQMKPHHHQWKKFHKEMQACLAKQGVTLPKFEPGQAKPTLDASQQAALDSCKQQIKAAFQQKQNSGSTSTSTGSGSSASN